MIIRSKSPFRISFGGGGTDIPPYCWEHGGAVINTTINKYAYASLRPNDTDKIHIHSLDYSLKKSFKVGRLNYDGELDLIKATINEFEVDRGFDLVMHSDMPPSSGMGTSSATAVAMIGALKEFMKISMDKYKVAEIAYHIEREVLGMEGGYQDQYASSFGGFNYMEIGKEVVVNPLCIPPEIVNELKYRLLLCYLGETRFSSEIQADVVKRYKEKEKDSIESMNSLKMIAIDMKNSLLKGNLSALGELLHHAWEEKKRLSRKIANPKIDRLYEEAKKKGAIGGKLLGAGGSGHFLFFCDPDKKFDVANILEKHGTKIIDFDFDQHGLQTWRVNE